MEAPIAKAQFTLVDLLNLSVLAPFEAPAYLLIAWSPLFAAGFFYITSRDRFRWSAPEVVAATCLAGLSASLGLIVILLFPAQYKMATGGLRSAIPRAPATGI
jgi:hypothetical protein